MSTILFILYYFVLFLLSCLEQINFVDKNPWLTGKLMSLPSDSSFKECDRD